MEWTLEDLLNRGYRVSKLTNRVTMPIATTKELNLAYGHTNECIKYWDLFFAELVLVDHYNNHSCWMPHHTFELPDS